MEAAIHKATEHEVEVTAGDRGIFDVHADGVLVYSKHAEGRFPTEEEILQKLA